MKERSNPAVKTFRSEDRVKKEIKEGEQEVEGKGREGNLKWEEAEGRI